MDDGLHRTDFEAHATAITEFIIDSVCILSLVDGSFRTGIDAVIAFFTFSGYEIFNEIRHTLLVHAPLRLVL